jgi:hypothetical protein
MTAERIHVPRLVDLLDAESYPIDRDANWTFAINNLPLGFYMQPPFELSTGGWIVIVHNIAGPAADHALTAKYGVSLDNVLENLGFEFEGYLDEPCTCRFRPN